MQALKEFASFLTMNMANLATTYATLLAETSQNYAALDKQYRIACGRKLLKATIETFKRQDALPLRRLFEPGNTRWPTKIMPPAPLIEVECLGQTLSPAVTNLDAGKFLWQVLFELRTLVPHPATRLVTAPDKPVPVLSPAPSDEMSLSETSLLKFLIDSLPELIYAKDTQSRFLITNAALRQQLGAGSAEEAYGKTDFDFSPVELAEKYFADEQALLASGQLLVTQEEPYFHNETGTTRWSKSTKIVFKDDAGNVAGLVGIGHDITTQKETMTQLEKLAAGLQTVAEVSTAISTILDVDQLLQSVVDLTKERFGLYHTHIYLLNRAEDVLVMTAGAGEIGRQLLAQGWTISLDKELSLVARAARSQKPVIVNDVRQSPDYFQNPLLPKTRSEMAVPVIAADELLGVLDVQAAQEGYFAGDEEQIYTTLAAQIAISLRNVTLYRQTQHTLSESETLYRASAGLNTAGTFTEVLEVLRKYTVMGQGAQNVSLNHFDVPWSDHQKPEWIEVLDRWSSLPVGAVSGRYPLAAFPSAETMLRADEPVIIADVESDVRLDESARALYAQRFGAQSTIFIPLIAGGQWIGFINAIYQQHIDFSEDEVRQVVSLSGQAAVAIQSIRRLMATQRQANREQTIREITEKMRTAVTLHELVETTARELGNRFGVEFANIELGLELDSDSRMVDENSAFADGRNGTN
jgi:PAS domain S-box-containing protein